MVNKHIFLCGLVVLIATGAAEPMLRTRAFKRPAVPKRTVRYSRPIQHRRLVTNDQKPGLTLSEHIRELIDMEEHDPHWQTIREMSKDRQRLKYQGPGDCNVDIPEEVSPEVDMPTLFSAKETVFLKQVIPLIEQNDPTNIFITAYFNLDKKQFKKLLQEDNFLKKVESFAIQLVFNTAIQRKDLKSLRMLVETPHVMDKMSYQELNQASLCCLGVVHDNKTTTPKQRKKALDIIKLIYEEMIRVYGELVIAGY